MKKYAKMAKKIVYQSLWAKNLISPMLGDGEVIRNCVDLDFFKPVKRKRNSAEPHILYIRSSRNEVKRWEECQYMFREVTNHIPKAELLLVGRFGRETIKYGFDFHHNERVRFFGEVSDRGMMLKIYQMADVLFFPNYAEACPNVVLEAQACGLPVLYNYYGGTRELVDFFYSINTLKNPIPFFEYPRAIEESFSIDRQAIRKFVESEFSLQVMGKEYKEVFCRVIGNN
jgi:glycosyltransferase involved in cell wall biosynthesis